MSSSRQADCSGCAAVTRRASVDRSLCIYAMNKYCLVLCAITYNERVQNGEIIQRFDFYRDKLHKIKLSTGIQNELCNDYLVIVMTY